MNPSKRHWLGRFARMVVPIRLLIVILVVVVVPAIAFSQTPVVQIMDITRGGPVLYAGDYLLLTITGGASNAPVVCFEDGWSGTIGSTDASGNFSFTNFMAAQYVGAWTQEWTVGGVPATPNPLTFYIYPLPAQSTCGLNYTPAMNIWSIDYWYWDGSAPYWQYLGDALVQAGTSSLPCVMYSDWFNGSLSIEAGRALFTPTIDQWVVSDNGYRPYYYYPYVDSGAALGYLAVNVETLDLYYGATVITLTVYMSD